MLRSNGLVNASQHSTGSILDQSDLIDFENDASRSTVNSETRLARLQHNANSKAAGLNSITEALNLIEQLRQDIEKMQMGISLLSLSVTKLMEIVSYQPSFCNSLMDMLSLSPSAAQTNMSQHSFSHHGRGSGSYTATNALHGSGSGSNHGTQSSNQTRRNGYSQVNTGRSSHFSIGGIDDED
jgi:hypothetical protein